MATLQLKQENPLQLYAVEFTDTFGGDANYCWRQAFAVWAPNIKQAITRAKQHRYNAPLPHHRLSYQDSDSARIDINGACVCAFINWIDAEEYTTADHGEIINGSD
jgi:hypothetical protein